MFNPMMIIQQLLGNNPTMKNNPMINNAMNMAQSNDVDGLKKMAENLAKSKGVNLDDVQRQVMQRFGMK